MNTSTNNGDQHNAPIVVGTLEHSKHIWRLLFGYVPDWLQEMIETEKQQ